MGLHRTHLAALLSSAVVAAVGAALLLQPAGPASAQPESGAGLPSGTGLTSGAGSESAVPGSGAVTFRADGDRAGTDSFAGPPTVIWCGFAARDPHVPALVPTRVRATGLAECTWPMPNMTVSISLFRGDNEVSSRVATGFGFSSFPVSTDGPCQGGAYYAAGTATIFPPPGYSPPFRVFTDVSNVIPINGAGTPVPPFVCQQSGPPPSPSPSPSPPPPSAAPVVSSFNCEYLGNNRFNCGLSATNWTQIRWSVNNYVQSSWNDRTSVLGGCSGNTRVDVDVSNAHGTTHRGRSFSCSGHPR